MSFTNIQGRDGALRCPRRRAQRQATEKRAFYYARSILTDGDAASRRPYHPKVCQRHNPKINAFFMMVNGLDTTKSHLQPPTDHLHHTTGRLHIANCRLQPTAGRLQPATGRLQPTTGRLHIQIYRLHLRICRLHIITYRLHLPNCRLQTATDRLQTANWHFWSV